MGSMDLLPRHLTRSFLALLVLLPLAACEETPAKTKPGAPVPAKKEAQETETWAALRISGQRAGHVYTRIRRLKDPKHGGVVEMHVFTLMEMKRMGATVKIENVETTRERVSDGALVGLRIDQKMARQRTLREFTFRDGWAHMTTTVMGKARKSKLRCPPEAVGPFWLEKQIHATGLKTGASLGCTVFLPDLGGAKRVTASVAGREDGFVKVEMEFAGIPFTPTNWYRESGELARTLVIMGGLRLEVTPCPKDEALKGEVEELKPDVFKDTLVIAPHGVAAPRRVDRAVLKVSARRDMPDLSHRRFQTVQDNASGETLVTIRKVVPKTGGRRPLQDVPEELKPSLAANSMIQSDAPEIVALANEVAGKINDAWRAAQTLEAWVHGYIKKKSLDIGLATALEVCKNREGDCSEHAVLLAAVCRASGIPARVCMGLEYIGGVWGGHAWNEVWIDGKWYPLDATNGYGFVDGLHLTLSSMTLNDADFGAEFIKLTHALGNLDIEIIEADRAGKTIRPAQQETQTDGDVFTHSDWGISFRKPGAFAFRALKKRRTLSAKIAEIVGDGGILIRIYAHDRPPRFDWKKYGPGERIEIGGKPALRQVKTSGTRVLVRTDVALFRFELQSTAKGASEALESLLASVKLDG